MRIAAMTLCMIGGVAAARAAPPEPTGPHPRMLLDADLKAAWHARSDGRNPIGAAILLCGGDDGREHAGAQYMGSEWKKMLQACLVAWAATGEPGHAATALRYFTALIDDLDTIGDHKGGDTAGNRDAGYAIRNLAPYTALAYDWLHDAPGMTPALRARARQRWAAWLSWFDRSGYHTHDPGSNYHAGYLLAATTVAIAQAGEAGDAGRALWRDVVDRMWNKEMAAALAPGGVLDGGDWDEGWQYAPLSVAEYALAARALRPHVRVDGVAGWLAAVLRRHVHALNPSDRLWVGGDLDSPEAYPEPSAMTLAAVALGDAGPDERRWARGELSRLKLADKDSLLYSALAAIGDPPVLPPRASWPTWYRAAGTATVFARTSWDDRAIWFVASCARTAALDHRSPNAGNFVLSRGTADLIVDPSPYGSLSTLTGNAPAVRSRQLPGPYQPSQGAWGSAVHWRWVTRTAGGILAARCDYSDAFRFQDRPSDVPEALRDFVLLPSPDGRDAQLVIVDRAITGDADRKMYLRFRVPAELTLDGGTAVAAIRGARLAIHGTGGALAKTALKDCFQPGTERGNCDAARIPVTDYRVEIASPTPRAVHVLDATGPRSDATSQPISGDGWAGIALSGVRDAIVVWSTPPSGTTDSAVRDHRRDDRPGMLTYRAPRRRAVTHVVLDAPASRNSAHITAKADGDACLVTVEPGNIRTTDHRPPPADDRPPPADDRAPPADGRTPHAERRTPPADGRTPPTDSRTPSTDSRQPSTDSRQPSTDSRQPSTDGRTPSTDGRTPSTDGRTPPADGRTPSTDGRTPSTDGRTPSTDGRTSPADGRTPSTDGRTPPADGRTPSTDGRTSPADGRTPSTDGRMPPTESRQPSTESRQPSTESRQPSTDGRVPPADAAVPASPLIVTLDEYCAITTDVETSDRVAPTPPKPAASTSAPQRAGCCGAGATAAAPIAMALLVLGVLGPLPRRPRRSR